MEILRRTPWSRIREQNSVYKGFLDGQCTKGDKCSFRHDVNKRAKMTQPNPSPNSFMQQDGRKASTTRSPRGKSPSGGVSRWPCTELAITHSVKRWHPPECLFYKTKSGCRFGGKCSYAHLQVDEQPCKGPNRMMTKSHDRTGQPVVNRDTRHSQGHGPVVCSSSSRRQLGCVFQDMEPPTLPSILRKSLRHTETNPTCEIHEGYCASH